MQEPLSLVVGLLATAVFAVVVFRRLRLPPLLAYLGAGVLAGPGGLGWVPEVDSVQKLAEFGIVFLMFSLGLEFSIPRLLALRRLVFGAGPLQILLTGLPILAVLWLLGFDLATSLIAADAFSLSSTAVVVRELIARGAVNTGYGRAATGVLLFQDLAAVAMLVLLPVFAGASGEPLTLAATTLGKAILLFAGIYVIGKWILPRVLEETGRARSDEVFVMTALLLALVAAWVTHLLGLSMALGAFLAGMMLGESHFRHQIEADIRPFRDLLLGLFFMGVGMLVSPALLLDDWYWIVLGAAALMLFKSLLTAAVLRLLGERRETAVRSALMLAQGGEFGFVLVALAVAHRLLSPEMAGALVLVTVLTMAVTPTLINHSADLTRRLLQRWQEIPPEPAGFDEGLTGHVLLCGYGRVGQNLMRYLERFHIRAVAIDSDLVRIREASPAGEPVLFGDATRKDLLERAGIQRASLLVVTFDDPRLADRILRTAHQLCPDLRVLVRTRDDAHLDDLLAAGAAEVVPEVLEASLMLVAHALMMLDVPFGKVLAMLRQSRRQRYKLLRGYYHGESLPTADSAGNPYRLLHAVTLGPQAAAIGQLLGEQGLTDRGVEVQGLRRGEQHLGSPQDDEVLRDGDILILYGPLEAVEAAEEMLLGG